MSTRDDFEIEQAPSLQLRVELLRPQDRDVAGGEGAADERPIRLDEAEHAVDGDGEGDLYDYEEVLAWRG